MRVRSLLVLSLGLVLAGCGGGGGGSNGAASTVAPATSAATTPVTSAAATPVAGTATPGMTAKPPYATRTKTAKVLARYGEGFLEEQAGYPILHVKGSAYERGVQYGYLAGDRVQQTFVYLDQYARAMAPKVPAPLWTLKPLLMGGAGSIYLPHYPAETVEMLQGMVDGAAKRNPPVQLTVDELAFVNAIIDIGATVQVPIFKCSGLAVWGSRTVGGKTYQLRNVDLMTGSGLEAQALVVIEKGAGKKAWANATWAGMVGSASGMNEHGVGLSQVWAFSKDVGIGQPWIVTARTLLESAENVDAVEPTFAAATRTYGSNFVFADRGDGRGGQPRAVALESTRNHLACFEANDARENASWNGIPLPIRMTEAVFRGDTAMDATIFGLHYGISSDPRTRGGYRDRYQQQANMVADYEKAGTKIGANEMKVISRQIAMSSGSLQCVVYENHDLVVHVANSRLVPNAAPVNAKDEPFHSFDLDYYLPNGKVTLDRADYAPGDVAELTLDVTNRGRARKLEARVRIELGYTTMTFGGALASFEAIPGASAKAKAKIALPATCPRGTGELILELVEAGTQDTVDFTTTPVVIK